MVGPNFGRESAGNVYFKSLKARRVCVTSRHIATCGPQYTLMAKA